MIMFVAGGFDVSENTHPIRELMFENVLGGLFLRGRGYLDDGKA